MCAHLSRADIDTQWRRNLRPSRQAEKVEQRRGPVVAKAAWSKAWKTVESNENASLGVDVSAFPSLGNAEDSGEKKAAPKVWASAAAVKPTEMSDEKKEEIAWPGLSETVESSARLPLAAAKNGRIPPPPTKKQELNANPNKPKPQKSYSILDAVVQDRRLLKQAKPSAAGVKAIKAHHAAAIQNKKNKEDTSSKPKHTATKIMKVPAKPKKRVLSSLKKRLLIERLEQQRALEEEAEGEGVLRWLNLATQEELEDELEREEIIDNVADMCQGFIQQSTLVQVGEEDKKKKIQVNLAPNAVLEARLPSLAGAVRAYRSLRGRIVAGEKLRLEVKDMRGITVESAHTDEVLAKQQLAQEIRLINVLDEDDDTEDEEAIDEILADLSDLVASRTGLAVSKVELILASRDAVVELDQVDQRAVAAEAVAALLAPPGLILAGRKIEARLNERSLLALRAVCDDQCLEDSEDIEETQSDLINICRRRLADACAGGRGDFVAALAVRLTGTDRGDAWLETKLDADLAKAALEGLVLGGTRISVDILNRGDAGLLSLALEDADLLGEIDAHMPTHRYFPPGTTEPQPLIVKSRNTGKQIKIPAKYAAAHLALQKSRQNAGHHRNPTSSPDTTEDECTQKARLLAISSHARFGQQLLSDINNTSHKREPVPLDGELDSIVSNLLRKLFDFQERVRLKEPAKFKMRRRLVFGLREVKRGAACNNVKLVFLAPNIEASQGIDASISAIIEAAKQNEIPLIFTLTKRRLGAAFSKVVGVSAVGVYSADGAHDDYKALLRRHKHIIAHPEDAIEPREWFRQKNVPKAKKNVIMSDKRVSKKKDDTKQTHSATKPAPSPTTPAWINKVNLSPMKSEKTSSPKALVATAPAYTPSMSGLVATAIPFSPNNNRIDAHSEPTTVSASSISPNVDAAPFFPPASLTSGEGSTASTLPNVDAVPFVPGKTPGSISSITGC